MTPDEQQRLYELEREQARMERDAALGDVSQAADPNWNELAFEAIQRTAETMETFISDDVWLVAGLPSTREDRALGPVFRRAAGAGICQKTNETRPSVRSHLSGKPVWRSLIYREGAVAA